MPKRWHAFQTKKWPDRFYVSGHLPRQHESSTVLLHRWIFDEPKDLVVDHINHDTLNNTRENLRVVTISINNHNLKNPGKNNKTSGIRGVNWNPLMKKWQARLGFNGKQMNLGFYSDIKEAEQVVLEARKKYLPCLFN